MARVEPHVVSIGSEQIPGPTFVELRLVGYSKDDAGRILLSRILPLTGKLMRASTT